MKFNKAFLLALTCWINAASVCETAASPEFEAQPKPSAFIYMTDGKPALEIPVLELCPALKPKKGGRFKSLSFRVTQGQFLVGGVSKGQIQVDYSDYKKIWPIKFLARSLQR
jgi:hypothetical protein